MIPGPSGPCNCGISGTAECEACRRSWVWEDGTIFDYDEFHDWVRGEPHTRDNCARLYIWDGWRGMSCDFNFRLVCKIGKLKERLLL